MKFNGTKTLLYENCSRRIAEKIKEKKISHRKLYGANPKIIGKILRNEIDTKRNPYLIQFAVLHEIKNKLAFNSYQEILWGSHEEIADNLSIIFQHVIYDLLSSSSKHKLEIENILCRYVPYARFSAYNNLLFETPIKSSNNAELYSVDILEAEINIDSIRSDAIFYLFAICKDKFYQLFVKFTESNETYKLFDKKLENWVDECFINMIKCYAPTSNSFGIRIKNIISSDYLYIHKLNTVINPLDPDFLSIKKLLIATENYINELESIQANCDNQNLFC